MNTGCVASYEDWRDDLLRGVGPVMGLPYALADLLTAAWINPDTYKIARGSIDMSPWGFPTDRVGTIAAIRARADLLRRAINAGAGEGIPQNVPDREGRYTIPVHWWNMEGYRLVVTSLGQYAFLYAVVDAFASAWRETNALPRARRADDAMGRWLNDAAGAVAQLSRVLGRKSADVAIPPVANWSARTIAFMAGRGEGGEGEPLRDTLENLTAYLDACRTAEEACPTAASRSAEMSRKRNPTQTYLRAGLALLDEYRYFTDGYAETLVTSVASKASGAEIEPHHVRQAQKALRHV